MVYMVIAFMLLFVAGTSWRQLAALVALVCVSLAFVLVAAPAVGRARAQALPGERLTAFLHPSTNPQKEGYQQEESKIAIGSGQKTGRGAERHPDHAQLRARGPHRLRLRRRRRAVRLRRRRRSCCRLYALLIWRTLRILDDVQGPVRLAGRRRGSGYADVSGVRQRGNDHWDHAHHRRHAAAHELWRLVGDHDPAGRRSAAIDLRPGARLSKR